MMSLYNGSFTVDTACNAFCGMLQFAGPDGLNYGCI